MYFNTDSKTLASMSVDSGESEKLKSGAICVLTGRHTGRAAKAKSYVRDNETESKVDWSSNASCTREYFDSELRSFHDYMRCVPRLFCQEVQAVRDPSHRLNIVVYTETPHHSLFVRNMFITDTVGFNGKDLWRVYHFPKKSSEPQILISFEKKAILITGTSYSGEIKKSIFSVLNFTFPQNGNLPMHCSVNVDKERGNPAVFFGLSGTGKTTLSSDEKRILIGDDEHGWTEQGITNFEGGCYAKTVRLSKISEPQIWEACNKPNTILENVVVTPELEPDFDDVSITENGRASYSCSSVPGSDIQGFVNKHPKNIVMLTCDAFGVLPPVMKLSPDEAVEQFLLGYTAKVAGTEVGVSEPQATFSACFGAPFMPLPPLEYAKILRKKIAKHETKCWLVNTGWSGGPYGVGTRMPISTTRTIIDKIHDGTLEDCEVFKHELTGFTVPNCTDIPENLLKPELGWSDQSEYKNKAEELISLFTSQKKKIGLVD
jgi:phosphoenolpyruvate carboxykinase (ATP)